MTTIDDGGPAFPHVRRAIGRDIYEPLTDSGMSLRDWFAGQALVGILAHNCDPDEACAKERKAAYKRRLKEATKC